MCGREYTHKREAPQASKKPLVEAYADGLWHPWHMLTLSLIIYHNPGRLMRKVYVLIRHFSSRLTIGSNLT
eukprot:jgi/Botrbrau1/1636/Bobra.0185s0046.1